MTEADQRIVRRAKALGLPRQKRSRSGLREYAFDKFEELLAELPVEPDSPDDLLKVVAAKLGVAVERVTSEEDLRDLAVKYGDAYPNLGDILRDEFVRSDTEGLTLRCQKRDPRLRPYLSVVDARGRKAYRAYFSEWHELTHFLVWPDQLEFDEFRRTPSEEERQRDPIESLVDSIAGELAFYEPLFVPALEAAIEKEGGLTFGAVESARRAFAESASFYGSARAAVLSIEEPACFVRAEPRLKKARRQRLNSEHGDLPLGEDPDPPDPPLRLVDFWENDAVEASPLQLHHHIRVPERSVLHYVHENPVAGRHSAVENQASWETSKKGPYPPLPIRVEATRRGEWVYALIQIADTESA